MSVEVILPKIDEAMTEGKIAEWTKQEGVKVEKGDILFVLETEKVSWEVESPAGGVLSKHLAVAGDMVEVGKIVAWILQEGESMPSIDNTSSADDTKEIEKENSIETTSQTSEKDISRLEDAKSLKIRTSPLAKKIAKENKIRLEDITLEGNDKKIRKNDVLKHIDTLKKQSAADLAPLAVTPTEVTTVNNAEGELVPVSTMRRTIARRMTESFQTVPHFFLTVEIEIDEFIKLRAKLLPVIEEITGKRLTLTDLFIKVATKAVLDVPEVNAYWTDEGIFQKKEINIGVAVNVEKGLVVPVIKSANFKPLQQIVEARFDLVNKAREGKLLPNEMKGGSLTISNLGMYGIDQFCPIINPPESCILGIGRSVKKSVIKGEDAVIRHTTKFTLSIDHRVLDGGIGSRFLKSIKDSIENPLLLI